MTAGEGASAAEEQRTVRRRCVAGGGLLLALLATSCGGVQQQLTATADDDAVSICQQADGHIGDLVGVEDGIRAHHYPAPKDAAAAFADVSGSLRNDQADADRQGFTDVASAAGGLAAAVQQLGWNTELQDAAHLRASLDEVTLGTKDVHKACGHYKPESRD
jgi:hypothetical protein